MKVVLLRVGIDSGSGGIQGPLFDDGGFEFLPIPDRFGIDERTYGNTLGRGGRSFLNYFPPTRRAAMADQSMHADPEWESFTYGDPSGLKSNLRWLQPGDMVAFYCGLARWNPDTGSDRSLRPALYLAGCFEVALAGLATGFDEATLRNEFGLNFHVRHRAVFEAQKQTLVLVKGDPATSRLFGQAHCISAEGRARTGTPLKVLSSEAQEVFGDFDGRTAIQRSAPRWVRAEFIEGAAAFLRALP